MISRLHHYPSFLCMLFLVLIGATIYSNALKNQFVWDDYLLIIHNEHIKDVRHLPQIFSKSTGEGAGQPNAYYRPIELLSYMIDYHAWKLNPAGYHLTNILLHLTTTLSVFWLLNFMFSDRLLSFITGLLYVSHPLHVEAVAYITGRPEIPAAIFMLLGLIAYDRFWKYQKKIFYIAALICCVCAFLSRENSIIFPFLIVLWHYGSRHRLRLASILPFFALTILYILLRLSVLAFTPNYGTWLSSAPLRIPGFFAAVTGYLQHLFLPLNLHTAYAPGSFLFAWGNPFVIAGIIAVVSLLFLTWRNRYRNRFVTFSIAWFFVCLSPYTNIYPRLPFYMNDHHMYLPSIGFFILCAQLICIMRRHQKKYTRFAGGALLFALVVFYATTTFKQNTYWREPIALYKKILTRDPHNAKFYMNLGQAYYEKGEFDEAIKAYEKALQLMPQHAETLYNIGAGYQAKKEHATALAFFQKALALSPCFAKALNNQGIIYLSTQEPELAKQSLHRSVECNPGFAQGWNNLATAYALTGDYENARTYFKKAIALKPDYESAKTNLNNINQIP